MQLKRPSLIDWVVFCSTYASVAQTVEVATPGVSPRFECRPLPDNFYLYHLPCTVSMLSPNFSASLYKAVMSSIPIIK